MLLIFCLLACHRAPPVPAATTGSTYSTPSVQIADLGAPSCGGLTLDGQGATLDLLQGRLTMPALNGMVSESMDGNIMGPRANDRLQQRFRVETEDVSFVVQAQEWFVASDPTLFGVLAEAAEQGAGSFVGRVTPMGAGGSAWFVWDSGQTDISAGNTIASATVPLPDNTLIGIAFGASGAVEPAGCVALAAQMLQMSIPGERALLMGPATIRLMSPFHAPLEVELPAGWTHFTTLGADFTVHNLVELASFQQPGAACGLYVGDHPGSLPGGEEEQVTVFGTPVTGIKGHADGFLTLDLQTGLPGDGSQQVHLFSSVSDEQEALIKALAASLRLAE